MRTREAILNGDAQQITDSMYQLYSAVGDKPPAQQIQAITMAFMILVDQLKLNMIDTLQTVRNILEDHSGQRLIRCAKLFVDGEIGKHFNE